jgi:hypothetical protein
MSSDLTGAAAMGRDTPSTVDAVPVLSALG